MSGMTEEMSRDGASQVELQHAAPEVSTPTSGQGDAGGAPAMAGRLRPRDDTSSETGKAASPRTDEEPQHASNYSLHRAGTADKASTRGAAPNAKTKQTSGTQVAGGKLSGRQKGKAAATPTTDKGGAPQLASSQQGSMQPKIAAVMASPIAVLNIDGHRKENGETRQTRLDNIQEGHSAAAMEMEEDEVRGRGQTGAGVTHPHTPTPSGPRARSPPPLCGTYRPECQCIYNWQLMPDNDMSESESLADGFADRDAAMRGWYACTLIHTLDAESTIDNTVTAIRADEKFMMRALCTPQEMILTAPIAGGYLTVVKAAMRPGTFVTDMDAAGVLIQNQVQKVRTATTNEKSTARQELIKIVYDMTGRSIEETRSTEEPRSTEDQPKEYCYFMLRAPGNQTVIVWERLSIQLAAEMSMLQDILGKEPSKITVVPAPFPIGSPKFGPGCAMAEKAEAHLYVDGLGEIEYVAEGGEKIMFKLSLCDAQYSPLLTPLQQEEKDKRASSGSYEKMNRQEELRTKREGREGRTVMIVGHLPLPCLGQHWLSEPCKPFRTAVNKAIHHMAKVSNTPIHDISHCHATSPNIGMLENRVLLWVEVEETFDACALDWNLIKTIPVTYGGVTYGIEMSMNGTQLQTLDLVQCCFRKKEGCEQEQTEGKCVYRKLARQQHGIQNVKERQEYSNAYATGETYKESKKRKAEEKAHSQDAARQTAMKEAQQRNQEGICQLFKEGKVSHVTVVPQHDTLPQTSHTVCKVGQGVLPQAHATEIQQNEYIMHLIQRRQMLLRLRGGMPLRETHFESRPDVGGVQPPPQEESRRLGEKGIPEQAGQKRQRIQEQDGVGQTKEGGICMRGVRGTGGLALSNEGGHSTGDPEGDGMHGLRTAQEFSPETLLYDAGHQAGGSGGRHTHVSSHTDHQVGGVYDRVGRAGGNQRTTVCDECDEGMDSARGAQLGSSGGEEVSKVHVGSDSGSSVPCTPPCCDSTPSCCDRVHECNTSTPNPIAAFRFTSMRESNLSNVNTADNPCTQRANCVYPRCEACNLPSSYCILCGTNGDSDHACKCITDGSMTGNENNEIVPCACRLVTGAGCGMPAWVPAGASAERRSRALCTVCKNHIGSEICGCECGACLLPDLNYSPDYEEVQQITSNENRHAVHEWLDNYEDADREIRRAQLLGQSIISQARCQASHDGNHRLYRCDICGLFSAFCGHCGKQKLALDEDTCRCTAPAAESNVRSDAKLIFPALAGDEADDNYCADSPHKWHSVPLCKKCGAYSAYCSYCGTQIATPEGSCQCASTGSQSQLHVSDSNIHVSTELGQAIAACMLTSTLTVYGVIIKRGGAETIRWYSATAFSESDLWKLRDLRMVSQEETKLLTPPPEGSQTLTVPDNARGVEGEMTPCPSVMNGEHRFNPCLVCGLLSDSCSHCNCKKPPEAPGVCQCNRPPSAQELITTPDDSACGASKGGCHALWCMRCRRHSRDCYACGNQVIRDEESCQCEYIAITHSRSTGRHAHSGLIPLRNLLILSHRLPWEDEGSGGSHD